MPQEIQHGDLQAKPIAVSLIPAPLKDQFSGGRRRRFGVSNIALAAVFGAFFVVAGGVGSALAADDDDEPFDKKLFHNFMHALGLVNGTEPGFNYQERPPLVVPPTRELPPPEAPGAMAARNPAWPVDPDVERRKAEKKAKAESPRKREWNDYGERLSPAELAAGKSNKPSEPSAASQPDYLLAPLSPGELGFSNSMFKGLLGIGKVFMDEPEFGTFVREPPRVSLTDPPPGYRSPSPEQPYGARPRTGVDAKKAADRQVEGTGNTR